MTAGPKHDLTLTDSTSRQLAFDEGRMAFLMNHSDDSNPFRDDYIEHRDFNQGFEREWKDFQIVSQIIHARPLGR